MTVENIWTYENGINRRKISKYGEINNFSPQEILTDRPTTEDELGGTYQILSENLNLHIRRSRVAIINVDTEILLTKKNLSISATGRSVYGVGGCHSNPGIVLSNPT
jgi:hypothetical protein